MQVHVTPLPRWPSEPAPVPKQGTGSKASDLISSTLALAREWAPDPRAVILSGSHASGEAVWVEHQGRMVSLSDVDLYVMLEDEAGCRDARARRGLALRGLAGRCLEAGLAAPLEAGFHTASGLARLPARPGTLELSRHGRVVRGEAKALDRVPRHRPGDVSAEEIALLLENRGCELLWCRPLLDSADRLDRLRGRHGVFKCALDLAGVTALLRGDYPDGHAARVAWAREHRPAPRDPEERELDRLWDLALAWRDTEPGARAPAEGDDEWRAAVRGWVRLWWEVGARLAQPSERSAIARTLALARRARLRRRLREAVLPGGGNGPGRWPLLAKALGGTLRHRVHASAALLLLAAANGGARAIPPPESRALARLGVVKHPAHSEWEPARRAVVRAWDRWLLDGQRTADPA